MYEYLSTSKGLKDDSVAVILSLMSDLHVHTFQALKQCFTFGKISNTKGNHEHSAADINCPEDPQLLQAF